jgi:trigger factor
MESSREQAIKQINEQIIADMKVEYIPETLINNEKHRLNNELSKNAEQKHTTKLELMGLQTESELDKEITEIAQKNIKLALAIEKIQDELKIEINEADVEEYLAKLAKVYNVDMAKIKEMTKNNSDWINVNISQRKTYDKLIELNKK